ncbi:MAG: Ser-Thr-rich GPI-anchored membrane family protein [Ignavibacteriaceae bacterium]|jgi:hypothetical protein
MKPEKIYIQLFFLLPTILLGGCRLLTGDNTEPISVVEPVYLNAFIITSPEKSSFWKPGDMMEIKWITSGSIDKVDIQLYRKSAFKKELENNLKNNGSFIWNIPNDIDHSLHYHIKIINHYNPDEYELSNGFAIKD